MLLSIPRARRVLQPRRSDGDDVRQDSLPSPDGLLARMHASRDALQPELEEATRQASRLLRLAANRGLTPLGFDTPGYPAVLAAIPDPPPVLWCRGTTRVLGSPAVAIVGSRAGSRYALEVAAQLGSELAGRGVIVVSGPGSRRRRLCAPRCAGCRRSNGRGVGLWSRCGVSAGAWSATRGGVGCGGGRQRVRSRRSAPGLPFPAAQPDH